MKKSYITKIICFLFCLTVYLSGCQTKKTAGLSYAEEVAKAYAEAINYDYEDPASIYHFMTEAFKAQMDEASFIEAFNKERSYPYLTPLYLNFDSVTLSEDALSGIVTYSQAARLPGMIYEAKIIFENGTYHIEDFEEFLDGSYLDKFDTVTYDLSSYFDMNVLESTNETQEK